MALWSLALGVCGVGALAYFVFDANRQSDTTLQTAAAVVPAGAVTANQQTANGTVSVATTSIDAPRPVAVIENVAGPATSPAASTTASTTEPTTIVTPEQPIPALSTTAAAPPAAAMPAAPVPVPAAPAVAATTVKDPLASLRTPPAKVAEVRTNAPAPAARKPTPKADVKKPTTVAHAKSPATPTDAKPAASASKTVVATTAADRKAKKTGQPDNDVDLIEALIVHTMQSGAPADAKGGK